MRGSSQNPDIEFIWVARRVVALLACSR